MTATLNDQVSIYRIATLSSGHSYTEQYMIIFSWAMHASHIIIHTTISMQTTTLNSTPTAHTGQCTQWTLIST